MKEYLADTTRFGLASVG